MKLVFENRINEAKITDYIDRDQLTDIVFNKNKEKFGNSYLIFGQGLFCDGF